MFNILISCSGRQRYLVKEFKKALHGRGFVFVCDINPNAVSMESADRSFVSPPYNDLKYIDWMLNLCDKYNIKLLITLNVDDLLVLEKYRRQFDVIGCQLIGGDVGSIEISRDKYKLYQLLKEKGFPTVQTWLNEEIHNLSDLDFPLIAKQRFGKGSVGIQIINSRSYLDKFILKNKTTNAYIFQKLIKGQEYGFDLINNFNCEFTGMLVRKKIAMKNGETFKAITVSPEGWIDFCSEVNKLFYHQGSIDVDAIVSDDNIYIIDVNFRFGGGYIFSHIAGANTPGAYVSWGLKESTESNWFNSESGVIGRRTIDGIEILNK